ncbi:MAG: C39 family peptidase [Candidatus Magasanikbacteria bacterium]
MKAIITFNITCLFLCAFFVLGTGYIWRGSFVHAQGVSEIESVKVTQFEDFTEEKINIAEETGEVTSSTENIEDVERETEVEPEERVVITGSMNLAVPFTSQAPEKKWEQPWQDACEEAAVLMLDAYYKQYSLSPLFSRDEIQKMVDWEEGKQKWGRSIEIEKLKELTEWHSGMDAMIIEDPTVEQIKAYISKGHPVLVVADGKELPNPHFRNGGPEYHAFIIRGYTEERFITNDPGTQFGENFTYLYDDLMGAIRDWNGGDVKNGKRVVLVVE